MGGALTILLAIFHSRFYKVFHWAKDFEKVTLINRKIIYTIHLALLLIFFMIGTLSLICAKELSQSIGLALWFNLFYAVFWIWRLVWQILYFKRPKGQKIPPIGIFLMILFALLILSYLLPVVNRFV
jgi:hypothetical protein